MKNRNTLAIASLVIAAANARTTLSANGINFIDEDQTGTILFGSLKKIANTAGTDANKHFNEF